MRGENKVDKTITCLHEHSQSVMYMHIYKYMYIYVRIVCVEILPLFSKRSANGRCVDGHVSFSSSFGRDWINHMGR